jgi:hypothetical protein
MYASVLAILVALPFVIVLVLNMAMPVADQLHMRSGHLGDLVEFAE